MPNHCHMLVQVQKAVDFSLFMKKLNLAYFYYYKKNYGWVGHFWQDRYKTQPVGKDEYFTQCGKYIELNPVRAQIIQDPGDYEFSSYRYYYLGENNDLITEDFMYQELDKDPAIRKQKYHKLIIAYYMFRLTLII